MASRSDQAAKERRAFAAGELIVHVFPWSVIRLPLKPCYLWYGNKDR
jgi:hypothetical protein